jgi:hypothetical protein
MSGFVIHHIGPHDACVCKVDIVSKQLAGCHQVNKLRHWHPNTRMDPLFNYHGGFPTKSDALDWVKQANNAADGLIASLCGSEGVYRGEM